MIQRLRSLFFVCAFLGISGWASGQSSILFPPQTQNPTCEGSQNGRIVFGYEGDSTEFFFSWAGGNLPTNGNPTTGNGIVRQTGLSAGTYSIFILDLVSGFDTTVQVALANSQPISVNAGNDISNCLGQPINLLATTTAGPGSSFVWTYTNAGGPRTLPGQNAIIPAFPSPNAISVSTTVTVTVTDPSGCTAQDNLLVTVNTPPTGQATPSAPSICSGPALIALSANQPGTSFIWTVSQSGVTGAQAGAGPQISQNLRTTGLANGTATYTIRPVSSSGCVGQSFQAVVTVRPRPIVSSSPDSVDLCSGSATAFSLNSNLSNTSYAWRALPQSVSGASNGTGAIIAQTLTTGLAGGRVVYRVAGTAAGCVSDTLRLVARVLPRPNVTVSQADTISVCSGQAYSFTYGSAGSGAEFIWSAPSEGLSGNGPLNSGSLVNSGSTPRLVDFRVQAIVAGCTSLVKIHRLRVLPLPVLVATPASASVCSGDSIRIALTSSQSPAQFFWTVLASGVSGISDAGGASIRDLPVSSLPVPGQVQYSIRALAQGCTSQVVNTEITVNPRPSITISPLRSEICSGSATSVSLTSATPGADFSWTVLSGTGLGANAGSGNSIQQILTNLQAQSDSVEYRIRSSFAGCAGDSAQARVVVVPKALPEASPSRPEICSGESVEVTFSPASTWTWTPLPSSVSGATSGSGSTLSAVLTLSGASDDSVRYAIRGLVNGCPSDTLFLTVGVHALPQITAQVESDSICSGQPARITLSAQPADGVSFSWTVQGQNVTGASGGTGAQINQPLSILAGTDGFVDYFLSSSRKGCSARDTQRIWVSNPVIPFEVAIPDSLLCDGDSIRMDFSSVLAGVNFSWTVSANGVTGAQSGSGSRIRQRLIRSGNGNAFVDYQIVPQSGACTGLPRTIRVSVNAIPAPPVIQIGGGSSPICPGQTLTLSSDQLFGNQWIRNQVPIPAPEGNARFLVTGDTGSYQVQFTDANGCQAISAPVRIDQIAVPPVPSISGVNGFCPGGNARLRSSALTGNQWFLNGTLIPGATDTAFSAVLGGTYQVRLLAGSCVIFSDTFRVTAFPAAAQPDITGENSYCAGDSVILSSTAAAAWQWVRNGNNLIGQTNATLVVRQSGNYQVRIQDANGCSAISNPFNVNQIEPNPTPIISGPAAFCPGDSLILVTGNINPAWGNQWYRDGVLLPGETLRTLVVRQAGTYTVTLESPRGCISISAPFAVTEHPVPPQPTVNGLTYLCPGGQTVLSSSATSGNVWFRDGIQILGANNPTYAASQTGTYTVVVQNQQGCRSVSEAFVLRDTTDIQATADLTDPSACGQANGSITVTVTGGTGQYAYIWSPISGGIVQGQANQSALSAGLYQVVVQDQGSGCQQILSGLTLNDPASFTASFQITDQTSCTQSNGRIEASVSGGTGPFTFSWAPIVRTGPNLNNVPAGWYSVRITEVSTGCVLVRDSLRVNNNQPPKPIISASGPLEFCEGDTLVLRTTAAGPYQWFRNNQPLTTATGDSLEVSQSGNYFVRTENPAFPGCFSRSDTLSVIVNVLPGNPSLGGNNTTNVCEGISVSLSNGSTLQKQWIKDGVDIPGANGNSFEVTTGGVYCLRVTDGNGCSRVSSPCRTINVNPLPPVHTISGNLGFCPGSSTFLVVSPFDTARYSYTWLRNSAFAGDNRDTLRVTVEGFYRIRAVDRVTDCRRFSDSVFVRNFSAPAAPLISGPSTLCPGQAVWLVSSEGITYQWSRNGQVLTGATRDSLLITQSGAYTVAITDTNGCRSTSVPFAVGDAGVPEASVISGVDSFCPGASVILTASPNLNYQWLFNGVALLNQSNQTISASLFGDYQVEVSNSLGCRDTSVVFTTIPGSANFTLDTTLTAASCVSGSPQSNGSILVEAIGGSGNYTYEWTPSLPPVPNPGQLAPGVYAVVVRDQGSGCFLALQNLVVPGPPTLALTSTIQPDTRCDLDNGSIEALVSGSAGPFSYAWTGSSETGATRTGLPAGTYEVVVTDVPSGCTVARNDLVVAGVDTFSVTASVTQPASCGANGLIAIQTSGGSGQFTYDWSGTGTGIVGGSALQSGLSVGVYAVTITDTVSRCSRSLNGLTLQSTGNLDFDLASQNPASCGSSDGTVAVIHALNNPQYQWKRLSDGQVIGTDSSLSGLPIGDYRLILQLGSCIDSADVNLSSPGLFLDVTAEEPSACGASDGSISLTADRASATTAFSWTRNGLPFSTNQNLSNLEAGTYRVRVLSAECLDSAEVVLTQPSAIPVTASIDTATTCLSTDGGITLSAPTPASAYTFSWIRVSDGQSVGGNTPSVTGLSSGLFRVRISRGACQDSANFSVPARNQPSLRDTLIAPSFCAGTNGQIIIRDSANFALTQIRWFQNGNLLPANRFTLRPVSAGTYTFTSESTPFIVGLPACNLSYDLILPDGSGLGLQAIADSADCADSNGVASVSAQASLSNPVYSWTRLGDPGFSASGASQTNLRSGTYQVRVQSGVCRDSIRIEVLKKQDCPTCSLDLAFATTPPSGCGRSDGRIVALVTNASNPVYTWRRMPARTLVGTDDTLSGVEGGLYRFVVQDGICVDSADVQLDSPLPLALSATADSASCANNDGSIVLLVNGSTPATTYRWTRQGVPSFTSSSQNLSGLAAGMYKVVVREAACVDSLEIEVFRPADCGGCALEVLASSQPATCPGVDNGTALAFIINGGTGPFSFQLNSLPAQTQPQFLASFANQPAGPFQVIVEDQTTLCRDTVQGIIGSVVTLTATAQVENGTCSGGPGNIRVRASGGVGPFSFTIGSTTLVAFDGDTVFAGLPSGTYTLLVANSQGCQTTLSNLILSTPLALQAGIGNAVSPTCAGKADGSVTITQLSGGSNPQYFLNGLSTSFQPVSAGQVLEGLKAGTYTLTIRAEGACDWDTTFTLTEPPALSVQVSDIQSSGCLDSTGSVRVSSLNGGNGGPWTIGLYRGADLFRDGALPADSVLRNLPGGSYRLLVFDSQTCPDTLDFVVPVQTQAPLTQLTADKSSLCAGETVVFTASNPNGVVNPVFTWFRNDDILAVTAATYTTDSLRAGDTLRVRLSGNAACLAPDSAFSNALHLPVLPVNLQTLAGIQAVRTRVCIGQSTQIRALNPNQVPDPGYRWLVNGILFPDTTETLTLFPGQTLTSVQAILFTRSTSACIAKNRDTSDVLSIRQIEAATASSIFSQLEPATGANLCPGTPLKASVRSNLRGIVPIRVEWYRNDTLVASGPDTFYTYTGLFTGLQIKARVRFDSTLTCLTTNGGAGRDTTLSQTLSVLPAGDIRCQPCSLQASVTPSNINCAGAATGAITVSASGGSGIYRYSLLPGGPANQELPFFFGLAPGTYTIEVRDTVTKCLRTFPGITLSVQNTYNVVVAATNPSPCVPAADGKLEFVSITDGSTDLGKYKFRIRTTDAYTTSRIFTGLASGTYTMEALDTLSGCLTQVTRVLTAPPAIQAQVSVFAQPACYGEANGRLRLDTVLNGSGVFQYSLSGDSGTFAPVAIGGVLPNGFAAGTYTVYVRDVQTGCLDTVQRTFLQPDSLKLEADVLLGSQCFAPTGQIKLTRFAGGTGALSIQMRLPGSTLLLPVVLPADSILVNLAGGDYLFRITDQNSCQKDLFLTLPSNSPRASAIELQQPCAADSNGVIRLRGLSGGRAPYVLRLLDNQGNILREQADTVFAGLKPGTYVVALRDSSEPVCETLYTRTLVQPEPLRFGFSVVKASTCEDFDGVVKFVLRGAQPGYRYSIDSLPGQFTEYRSVVGDTLFVRGLSRRAPGQEYRLRILDAGPGQGCAFDTTFNLPGDAPLRFRHSTRNVKCFGENSGAFILDSLNGTGPVKIRVLRAQSGELVKEDSVTGGLFFNVRYEVGGLPSGEFNVLVQQYGACNASRAVSITLTEPSQIRIEARAYRSSAPGFAMGAVLLDTVRGSVRPYTVSFDNAAYFAYKPDTLFEDLNPGVYTLRVRDSIGCEVSRDITVEEDRSLFVPTLFTPNGDQVNDRFEIRNLPAGSSLEVRNRWGDNVFKADPYGNDWEAKDLQSGTYFWILTIPGQPTRNGWVEVQR